MPPENGLSNFRMANDALIGRLNKDQRPPVMRMEGELGPGRGRRRPTRRRCASTSGATPRWDLLLLGLGPDAHCASLFPGKPEVEERSRLVAGVELAGMEPQVPRISLTLPALNARAADRVPRHRRGQGRGGGAGVRRPDPDPSSPAAHVRPTRGRADRGPATRPRPRSSDERPVHRRRRRRHEDRRRRRWRAASCPRRGSCSTNQASQEALVEQIAAAIEGSMSRRDARGRDRHAVDHRVRDRQDPRLASTSRCTTSRCASC